MHISTDGDWTSNLLHVGFFCQDFFSLLAEALAPRLGELSARIQLLDPPVQFLGDHLRVRDATARTGCRPAAGSRGLVRVLAAARLALALPQCPATGRWPRLAAAPELAPCDGSRRPDRYFPHP